MTEQANVSPPLTTPVLTPAGNEASQKLQGKIGVLELMLTVLRVLGAADRGGRVRRVRPDLQQQCADRIAIAVVLLPFFSVGYTTMTPIPAQPGGVLCVHHGRLGLASGPGVSFLAMFGYVAMALGTVAFFGTICNHAGQRHVLRTIDSLVYLLVALRRDRRGLGILPHRPVGEGPIRGDGVPDSHRRHFQCRGPC